LNNNGNELFLFVRWILCRFVWLLLHNTEDEVKTAKNTVYLQPKPP